MLKVMEYTRDVGYTAPAGSARACVCVCARWSHTACEFTFLTIQEVPGMQMFMNQGKSF